MEQLQCKSCGAPLTRDGRCEYCGARYRIERAEKVHVVELEHPKVRTLAIQTSISADALRYNPEGVTQAAVYDMTHSLANELAGFLTITKEEDRTNRAVMIRGKIRFVEPDFRF